MWKYLGTVFVPLSEKKNGAKVNQHIYRTLLNLGEQQLGQFREPQTYSPSYDGARISPRDAEERNFVSQNVFIIEVRGQRYFGALQIRHKIHIGHVDQAKFSPPIPKVSQLTDDIFLLLDLAYCRLIGNTINFEYTRWGPGQARAMAEEWVSRIILFACHMKLAKRIHFAEAYWSGVERKKQLIFSLS